MKFDLSRYRETIWLEITMAVITGIWGTLFYVGFEFPFYRALRESAPPEAWAAVMIGIAIVQGSAALLAHRRLRVWGALGMEMFWNTVLVVLWQSGSVGAMVFAGFWFCCSGWAIVYFQSNIHERPGSADR